MSQTIVPEPEPEPGPGSGPGAAAAAAPVVRLGRGAKGMRGTVIRVGIAGAAAPESAGAAELERRLLEIGFVEGAAVEILHEGWFRRDPIVVRLDEMRVALRRREADAILVRLTAGTARVLENGS